MTRSTAFLDAFAMHRTRSQSLGLLVDHQLAERQLAAHRFLVPHTLKRIGFASFTMIIGPVRQFQLCSVVRRENTGLGIEYKTRYLKLQL